HRPGAETAALAPLPAVAQVGRAGEGARPLSPSGFRNSLPSMTTVAEQRGYSVRTVLDAKTIGLAHAERWELTHLVESGLPEIDDRYHVWRVPLVVSSQTVGEVVIDARTGEVD